MRKAVMIFGVVLAVAISSTAMAMVPHSVVYLESPDQITVAENVESSVTISQLPTSAYLDSNFDGPSLSSSYYSSSSGQTGITSQTFDDGDLPISPGSTTTPIPEPASMILLGIGLIGGGMAARRRRKQ